MPVARPLAVSLPTQSARPAIGPKIRASRVHRRIAMAVVLAGLGPGVARIAEAKPFENYLKPTPIVCSPLSSASWGVAGVLPRDLCNGIENAKGAAVPPDWYYWDGQIIRA